MAVLTFTLAWCRRPPPCPPTPTAALRRRSRWRSRCRRSAQRPLSAQRWPGRTATSLARRPRFLRPTSTGGRRRRSSVLVVRQMRKERRSPTRMCRRSTTPVLCAARARAQWQCWCPTSSCKLQLPATQRATTTTPPMTTTTPTPTTSCCASPMASNVCPIAKWHCRRARRHHRQCRSAARNLPASARRARGLASARAVRKYPHARSCVVGADTAASNCRHS